MAASRMSIYLKALEDKFKESQDKIKTSAETSRSISVPVIGASSTSRGSSLYNPNAPVGTKSTAVQTAQKNAREIYSPYSNRGSSMLRGTQQDSGWTKEKEDEVVKLRDYLESNYSAFDENAANGKGANVVNNTPQYNAAKSQYNALLAERDSNSGSEYAKTGFLPDAPGAQSKLDYISDSVGSSLVGAVKGMKNAAVDTGALIYRGAAALGNAADNGKGFDAQGNLITTNNDKYNAQIEAANKWQMENRLSNDAWSEKMSRYHVNPLSAIGLAGNVAGGIAGMLPSIAANAVVPGAGLALMGASAAGNSTTEAIEKGANLDEATVYGWLSGAVEVATEKITGGIPGLGAGGLDDITDMAIKKIAKSASGRYAIKSAMDILGEGFEEWLSEAAGEYLIRIYDKEARKESVSDTWKKGQSERLYSALLGSLTSLVMNAPSQISARQSAQEYNAELNGENVESPNSADGNVYSAQDSTGTQNQQIAVNYTANQETQQTGTQTGIQPLPRYQAEQINIRQIPAAPYTQSEAQAAGIKGAMTDSQTDVYNRAVRSGMNKTDGLGLANVSKQTGANIAFDTNLKSEAEYNSATGTITINPNAATKERTGILLAVHELSHRAEASQMYSGLHDYVLNSDIFNQTLKDVGIDLETYRKNIRDSYAQKGMQLDEQGVDREIVAKFAERFLSEQTTINRIVAQDRTLAEKIRDFFADLAVRFKGTAYEKELLNIRNMYNKALKEAKTSEGKGGVQYSLSERHIPNYEELIEKEPINIVDIRENIEGKSFSEMRKTLKSKEDIANDIKTPHFNDDTGEAIYIIPSTYTHIFSNAGIEQLQAALKLPQIIKHAILTDGRTDRSPTANSTGIYTFFGAVRTNNGIMPIKLKVREFNSATANVPNYIRPLLDQQGKKDYATTYDAKVLVVEEIEELGDSGKSTSVKPISEHPTPSSTTINVADLLSLVKGDATKYIPSPNNFNKEKSNTAQKSVQTDAQGKIPTHLNADSRYLYNALIEDFGVTSNKNEVRAAVADYANKYINGEARKADADSLFKLLYERGTEIPEYDDYKAAVNDSIKGARYYVSEDTKSELAHNHDTYKEFFNKARGKFKLTNDPTALRIDVAYQELQDIYGTTYFPEVNHQAEMLENILNAYEDTQQKAKSLYDAAEDEAWRGGSFEDFEARYKNILNNALDRFKRVSFSERGTYPKDLDKSVMDMIKSVDDGEEGAANIDVPIEIAQALTGKGVGFGKDFFRNMESAANGDTEAKTWIDENVVKPLEQAKQQRVDAIYEVLSDYKKQMDKYGIKKGSKESSATMWFGEGVKEDGTEYTLENLKRDFPNKWKDIVAFDKVNRKIYNDYITKINESLAGIYPNVERDAKMRLGRKIASLEELNADIEKMLKAGDKVSFESLKAARNKAKALDHDVRQLQNEINSGEIFRNKRLTPRKNYYHHFKDVLQGVEGLRNILSTSAEIDPRLVGVSDNTKPKSKWAGFLQKRNGGEYKADAVSAMLDYIPAVEYKIAVDPVIAKHRGIIKSIAESTSETRNANKFLLWMTRYTDTLAGKTNNIDRAVQEITSRKTIKSLGWLNGRVKSNTLIGNLRSALVQVGNVPNAALYVTNPKAWTKGVIATFSNDQSSKSSFLKERFEGNVIDSFDPKWTPKKTALWLLSAGDTAGSKLIWNVAYQDALSRGESNPVLYADRITRKSVAGRGVGELPITQQSKILNFAAPFQVEVNNSYLAIRDALKSEKAAQKIMGWAALSFAINSLIEPLTGDRPLPDIIDSIIDAIKGWDEDDEDDENIRRVMQRLSGEVVSILPYSTQLASWALGEENSEAWFGDEDPTRYGTANIGAKAVANVATSLIKGDVKGAALNSLNVALPWGGTQLKRTIEGLSTVAKGGDYGKDGSLKYAVENTGPKSIPRYLMAAAFGKWSLPEARDYIERGFKPMYSKTRAEARTAAINSGMDSKDFDTYFTALNAFVNSDNVSQVEALYALFEMGLSEVDSETLWKATNKGWSSTYAEYAEKNRALIDSGVTLEQINYFKEKFKTIDGIGAKEKKRELIYADNTLAPDQKAAIDNALISDVQIINRDKNVRYDDENTFITSQMSESAQEKWKYAQSMGISAKDYSAYYNAYYTDTDGSGSTTKAEGIQNLINAGMSESDAYRFYNNVIKQKSSRSSSGSGSKKVSAVSTSSGTKTSAPTVKPLPRYTPPVSQYKTIPRYTATSNTTRALPRYSASAASGNVDASAAQSSGTTQSGGIPQYILELINMGGSREEIIARLMAAGLSREEAEYYLSVA